MRSLSFNFEAEVDAPHRTSVPTSYIYPQDQCLLQPRPVERRVLPSGCVVLSMLHRSEFGRKSPRGRKKVGARG
jgi:hypothetical protein